MTSVLAPPDPRTRTVGPGAPPRPPRLLVAVSLAVVAAGVTMGLLGALRTGVSWDEPYHVMRLRNYLDQGWFGLDWSTGGDEAGSNTLVYGPVAMLLLHGLGTLVGVEHADTVSATAAAYQVRHLGVLAIGLAGTAAAAAITRVLLSSWRWALVTAALLLALPMWTGHLMFNVKDVPVATGYTLTTLALVAMVAPVRSNRLVRVAGLAGGTVLMVGTRPAMVSALLVGLAVLAVGVFATGRFGNARTALTEASTGVLGAALVLLAVYPKAFSHPGNLVSSTEQSARFRGGADAVYGYIPFHVLAQVPLLLLGFFVVGLLAASRFGLTRWRTDTARVTRYALVGAQLLALPVAAILQHSDLYNGLRQLLFAAPAWAVLTTLGVARAVTWARSQGRVRLVAATAVVALVAPVLDQVTLFPYQYTYYNPALDLTGVHVPSDYWRVSVPALVPDIPTDGQVVCSPTRATSRGAVAGTPDADRVAPTSLIAGRYSTDSSVDCRTDPLGPLAPVWGTRPRTERLPRQEFYAVIDRDHPLPRNCTGLAAVERTRHGRTLAMTYLARCRARTAELGTTPVTFDRDPGGTLTPAQWAYAAQGWVSRGSPTAVDATGPRASLSFRTPARCARTACVLVLSADLPPDLRASTDDGPAVPTGSRIALPRGSRDVWITFTRAGGAPLGLRLHALRISKENP